MWGRVSSWSVALVLALAFGLSGCGDDENARGLASEDRTESEPPGYPEDRSTIEIPSSSEPPTEVTSEPTTEAPSSRPSRNAADAPTDATPTAFCREWDRTVRALDAVEDLDEPGFNKIIARLDDLEVVGTPEAIPARYRKAFEIFVSGLDDVVYDEDLELDADVPGTSPREDELVEEFTDWGFEFCGT